jgi:multiple sugar transport system substrate-binding protein
MTNLEEARMSVASADRPTRRRVLRDIGLAAGTAACPSIAFPAIAQSTKKLVYVVWAFEPQTHREHADRFEAENPGYKVEMVSVNFRDYVKKVLAMINAGEQIDAMLVYNFHVASWAEGGIIQAVDGMPGIEDFNRDMLPFVRDIMFYKGKQYGLPYYQDIAGFMWREDIVKKAGFSAPPKSLDELKTQALEIKKQKIMEYPIVFEAILTPSSMYYYYSLVYGSGGRFFDSDLEPTIPDRDEVPVRILEWLVEAFQNWKIADSSSMEMDPNKVRDVFAAGNVTFTILHRYYLRHLNDPKLSKVAGLAKFAEIPGLPTQHPSVEGWARLYGMGATAPDRNDAWKLVSFLGGKNKAGEYYTAKRWVDLQGLGPGYTPVISSPKVIADTAKWVDPEISGRMARNAVVREISKTTWYPEADLFMQQQVQKALLRQVSPREALAATAAKVRELKKS